MIEEPFVSAGAGGEEEPGRMSKRAHFGEERERERIATCKGA